MITPFFNNISPFEDIRSNHNNNNNTCRAPISILLFSSALKNKNIKKQKTLRLHKVYMQKVHEPTKKSQTIMSTLKTIKIT